MKNILYCLTLFFFVSLPVSAEEFLPRGEMAIMLYEGYPDKDNIKCTINAFTDTNAEAFYNEAVSSLSNAGVFQGYRCGKFAPDRNTSCAEFLAATMRLYNIELSDSANLEHKDYWYYSYIHTAVNLHLINTSDEYYINPDIAI